MVAAPYKISLHFTILILIQHKLFVKFAFRFSSAHIAGIIYLFVQNPAIFAQKNKAYKRVRTIEVQIVKLMLRPALKINSVN